MRAWLPPSEPANWAWVAWLLPLAAVVAIATAVGQANAWAAINLALLIPMWALAVAAHEAGHAVAARALGFQVPYVVIGNGPRVATIALGRTTLILHAVPFSGAAFTKTSIRKDFRRRSQVVVSAGAFVNVVLALVGIAIDYGAYKAAFVAPAPFTLLAAANIFALRQTATAGRKDGVLTDVNLAHGFATATEAQIDEMFERQR